MEPREKQATRAAAEEISKEFESLVSSDNLDSLKQLQNLILGRLQDSNAVLSHFNVYSKSCFGEASDDFSTNKQLLKSMKSDLDYIFVKLRAIKSKLMAVYPDAFPDDSTVEALDRRPDLERPT